MYDELALDTLGDRKTAMFFIISDTDASFNFLVSMAYTQLFNLLCEKADDVYGGRLPIQICCSVLMKCTPLPSGKSLKDKGWGVHCTPLDTKMHTPVKALTHL